MTSHNGKLSAMRSTLLVAFVAAAVAVAGCGGGTSSHATSNRASNQAKVQQAQRSETSAADVHAKLAAKLHLHYYAGVNDVFDLPSGGMCYVQQITAGPDAQGYAGNDYVLISPD